MPKGKKKERSRAPAAKAAAERYAVRHAFAHDGAWYSRRNQDDVASLPRAVREQKLAQGFIAVEIPAPAGEAAPAATDAAPAPGPTTEEEK